MEEKKCDEIFDHFEKRQKRKKSLKRGEINNEKIFERKELQVMNKKLVITLISIYFLLSESYTERINFNIFFGRTSVEMKDANEELRNIEQSLRNVLESLFELLGGTTKSSLKEFKEGDYFTGWVTYELTKQYSIGVKASYLSSNAQILVESSAIVLNQQIYAKVDIPMNTNLTSIMVGNSYLLPLSEKFQVLGSVWFGYSYADFNGSVNREFTDQQSQNYSFSYKGEDLVAEGSVNLQYVLSQSFLVGFEVGYRYVKIDELKSTKDVTEMDVETGDVLKTQNDEQLPFDYTGLFYGINIVVRF